MNVQMALTLVNRIVQTLMEATSAPVVLATD